MPKPKNPASDLFADELERLGGVSGLADVYEQLERRSRKVSENTGDFVDKLQDAFDEAENVADSQKDLFSTTVNLKSLQRKANQEKNRDMKKIYQSLVQEGRVQANLRKEADVALKSYRKKEATVKKLTDMIPGVGGMLGNIIDGVGEAYKDGLGKGLDKGEAQLMGIGKGFKVVGGLMVAAIFKNFYDNMTELGVGLRDTFTRPEFFLFGKEMRALSQEFGNINEGSMRLGLSMKMTSIFSGVTAENQAKILGMMSATSDASLEVLNSQMKAYKQAGVPFKLIMDDVAGNTELFAKFAKDGGGNIFDAAKRARELGVSLSDVASISESLLNFESSIEAQMNAQVLLGKSINLDRARQLAFAGEQSAMMDEIVSQVGGEAEFNKLNVIQRKALADSVGLSVDRMAALVREEEKSNKSTLAKAALFIGVGAAIGAAVGMIGSALIASGVLAPLGFGMFAGLGPGALAGGAIGAAAGAGAFAMGASKVPSFQTAPGQAKTVGQTGLAEVHQGETIGRFDMSGVEERLDTLIVKFDKMAGSIADLETGGGGAAA